MEVQLAGLITDVAEHHATVMDQIQGGLTLKREDSIRGRLHVLEGDRAAATAAALALTEAQREHTRARRDRKKAEAQRHAQWWRWVGAVIAAAAVIAPYIDRVIG